VQNFQNRKDIQVRIGKNELKSTVELECSRQLEIYISNARTRIKRTVRGLSRSMNQSDRSMNQSDRSMNVSSQEENAVNLEEGAHGQLEIENLVVTQSQ